ncbi:hypothetical protein [Mycoplasmopsis fermentans]|uniref:Uncharacterized protein n=1 Tax=Mycoplasmopsis fermentans (strain M64) TaxID=943945 RepID=A0AB32XC25_MYCFM|nr:hypothetical protein [Mycoplasmopsis fermentans]ADV34640.1 Hypothetical Protein MfeM64YM_0642 [Mycoplasmopsis fermentans M64]
MNEDPKENERRWNEIVERTRDIIIRFNELKANRRARYTKKWENNKNLKSKIRRTLILRISVFYIF